MSGKQKMYSIPKLKNVRMGKFSSEIKIVNQSAEKLFEFLTDLNNFRDLLPPQVKNWQSTKTWCSFDIEGTASLGFEINEKNPNSIIRYKEYGKSPFPFYLIIKINEELELKTRVGMEFEADLNPMMKMMLKKPLTNLLNLMVDKLNELNL